MKYLSFVVPCYNSEQYMRKCIDSLLVDKSEDVEVLIVNDGSKDSTSQIAHEYEEKYPTIVRVFDKENGGHGSALNVGIQNATGLYFKCVDSDDWVDPDAYRFLLETIKINVSHDIDIDLYVNDFVYERVDRDIQYRVDHRKKFPVATKFGWDDIKRFGLSEYFMMHSLIFSLDVLKKCNLVLPEKTYYIDNYFVYAPLKFVKSLYYIPVPFYRYYVGRNDQSVTFDNMIKNHMMQLTVMKEMTYRYSYEDLKALGKKHRRFMLHDFSIISILTLFYFTLDGKKETKQVYKNYLKEFKEKNPGLYRKIRYQSEFSVPFLLIPPIRDKVVMAAYRRYIKITNWN